MKFGTEVELAEQVCFWLEKNGYEVYKEVFTIDGDIDIVAVKKGLVWAIECKKSYTNTVCEQAYSRLKHAHYVSIAIPGSRNTNLPYDFFLKYHGIGKIEVNKWDKNHYVVIEDTKPKISRPKQNYKNFVRELRLKRIRSLREFLSEKHKDLVAGSRYGGQITPYKITISKIKELLSEEPKTMSDIIDTIDHHYSSNRSAKSSLAKAMLLFEKGFKSVKGESGETLWSYEGD